MLAREFGQLAEAVYFDVVGTVRRQLESVARIVAPFVGAAHQCCFEDNPLCRDEVEGVAGNH